LKRSDFHYELPPELIAQEPLAERSASRLLRLAPGVEPPLSDLAFSDLPGLLQAGDLLVFNNTRVIPARLFARKDSGGKVEVLLKRLLSETDCLAMVRASKSPGAGRALHLEDGSTLRVLGREGAFFRLRSESGGLSGLLERYGHMPLPPYIEREDRASDRERYQTVYASAPGAVAAPTAGLHFTPELLQAIDDRGIQRAELTLHVGAGTFQPVRSEHIEDHRMHAEFLEVNEAVCETVNRTRRAGGRVIAVGTTAVRALETAAAEGELKPFRGDSRIFIYPGYCFRVIDGLLTNFHLPESTLIMLVSALAGIEPVRAAYRHAVQQRYRFFSYGDAMLVLPGDH
jgi:S-adenosylmethionine:tRNA ribosyltransferase-isomerase